MILEPTRIPGGRLALSHDLNTEDGPPSGGHDPVLGLMSVLLSRYSRRESGRDWTRAELRAHRSLRTILRLLRPRASGP